MNKYISKDMALKVLSVFVAFLLWSYVITEQNPIVSKDYKIPVDILNIEKLESNKLTLLEDPNSFVVNLRLKGRRDVIDKVDVTAITAEADMRGYNTPGDMIVPVELKGIPNGAEITSRLNETIKVKIENLISKEMDVTINIVGTPNEGSVALTAMAEPHKVMIIGAESAVESVKTVSASIDIASQSKGIKKRVKLEVYSSNGTKVSNVDLSPREVDVTIPIENVKLVGLEYDYYGELAPGYHLESIEVAPTEIYIAGKSEVLNTINKLKIEKVDLTGKNASFSVNGILKLPAGVQLLKGEDNITVNVVIAKEEERQVSLTGITFENMPEGFTADPITESFTVKVVGTKENLDKLSNLEVFVDLKDAKEGENLVEVQVVNVKNLKVRSIDPGTITVTLKPI